VNAETVGKSVFGLSGAGVAILAENHGTIEAIKYWIPWALGAAVALASLISISIDIYRKLKNPPVK
jgi:glycerol uptake facilitator-like aquaporin